MLDDDGTTILGIAVSVLRKIGTVHPTVCMYGTVVRYHIYIPTVRVDLKEPYPGGASTTVSTCGTFRSHVTVSASSL